jgi:VCBS repeat protein
VVSRQLQLAIAAALVVVGASRPAEAAPLRRHHRPISHVTLTPDGTGTLIRITYAGRARPHTRILGSHDPIDALAVADVDNDGDLDILAAQQGGDLVLWRNAGRGRFIFAAAAPARRALTRREPAWRAVLDGNEPVQSGDERYSAAMPRASGAAADSVETPHVARASSLVLSDFSACSQGRAPPSFHA